MGLLDEMLIESVIQELVTDGRSLWLSEIVALGYMISKFLVYTREWNTSEIDPVPTNQPATSPPPPPRPRSESVRRLQVEPDQRCSTGTSTSTAVVSCGDRLRLTPHLLL
jgi:hypothetical protein